MKKIIVASLIIALTAMCSYALNADSLRIAKELHSRSQKIRSGKITYEFSVKRFSQSKPIELVCDLSYTSMPDDSSKLVVFWDRKNINSAHAWHDEVMFCSDTEYGTSEKQQEISFSPSRHADFIEFYDDNLWIFSFGLYSKDPFEILSVPGDWIYSDTLIKGEPCYSIVNRVKGNGFTEDSTLRTWIFSKTNCCPASYNKTIWGRKGISTKSYTCISGEYSESYDTKLAEKTKARISSLVKNSGYKLTRNSED